jgi:hypothetical protein
MSRHSYAAGIALAVGIVLGLAGPVAAGDAVPFKGSLAGDWSRTPLDPPFVFDEFDVEGNATQLGEFDLVVEATVNLVTRSGSASFKFVAANGDVVTAQGSGRGMPTAVPGVVLIMQDATITGGTGRFAGATGNFTVTQLLDTVTGTVIGSFDGTISSPGANAP